MRPFCGVRGSSSASQSVGSHAVAVGVRAPGGVPPTRPIRERKMPAVYDVTLRSRVPFPDCLLYTSDAADDM
eukprot:2000293-Alexandrium_andersonii.AAC.1